MNGRIYDPVLGQFMQPDNFIQTPEDYIGYDRYSYCRGNPFKFTDPSGELLDYGGYSRMWDMARIAIDAEWYRNSREAYWERTQELANSIGGIAMAPGNLWRYGNIYGAGGGGGGGGGPKTILGRLFHAIGKFLSGTPTAVIDPGTGVRAMSAEALQVMRKTYNNVGLRLNYSTNSDGTFTITGVLPNGKQDFDFESFYRTNAILASGKSINIQMGNQDGSWFIPQGNKQDGVTYSTTTVLLESGGTWVKKYDYTKAGIDFPIGPNGRFVSSDESFVHEFLGHGFDYAMGDYSWQSIALRETNAVLMTNHYREFMDPNARMRTLYENPAGGYYPLYFDGGWQGGWAIRLWDKWFNADEIQKVKRP